MAFNFSSRASLISRSSLSSVNLLSTFAHLYAAAISSSLLMMNKRLIWLRKSCLALFNLDLTVPGRIPRTGVHPGMHRTPRLVYNLSPV